MNYENFLGLLRDKKVQEEIKDLYCKLQEESYENSSFQGWEWSIILSEDGEVDYMYASQGTSRTDIYKGWAIVVAKISDSAEVTTEDMGDIESVFDYNEFIEYLKNDFEYEVSPYEENFEEKRDEYVKDNCNWMEYYEFNRDNHYQIEKETWLSLCAEYSYDEAFDCIYNTIEELESRLEYYESFEQEK